MVVFHNDIINAIAQARNIRHLLASDILERWQQGEEATAEQTQSLIQLGDWIDFLTDAEQLVVEECIDSTDVWNIIQQIGEQAIGLDCVGTNYDYNNLPPIPIVPVGQNYVESVTGLNTNNADPQNPVVRISVDGTTITGQGTPASPLVASIPASGVQSVTDDGNGVVVVDNSDPANPIVQFNGVNVDGVTILGNGSSGSPLEAVKQITLETNSTPNPTQNILNLVEGTGINITDDGSGNITIDSTVVGSQNLQEVTDIGNITTNNINVGNLSANYSQLSPSAVGTEDVVTGTYAYLDSTGFLGLNNANGNESELKNTNVTNTGVVLEFPDKPAGSYTIATEDEITTIQGDISTLQTNVSTAQTDITNLQTGKQNNITLTTSGTSGAATLIGSTLNIPQYSGGSASPLTTKGDLYTHNSTVDARLPIGLDTQILMADSTTATGLKWASNTTPPASGYYGAFQDNVTQTAAVNNVGYPMILRTTDLSNGVTVVTNGTNLTRITFANTGIYNLQFSSQFQNASNADADVTIWLRKNSTDVTGSAGFIQVPKRLSAGAGNEGHIIVSWNYLLDIVGGEYYEIVWSTTDAANITMQYYPAGSPPPSTASVIVTVTQQAGILAGTGITAINSLTGAVQTMGVGTSGTDFAISSSGTAHTFNLPIASATNTGKLSAANWSTFNGKQDAITGAATTITTSNLTASKALVSDGSGKVAVSTVTSATLAFLDATSSIQTQLNGKEPSITAGTTAQYYRGDKTFQTLDKTAVGLGNVDNTSDATKNSATATLTNKRITARTGTVASSATPTINTDNVDYYSITALAVAITSMTTNLSGTPTTGQTLWISITDNGTARAITWGASFEASGNVALPTTTVISTRLDVAFIWNEATSKWRCVGVA